MLNGAQLEGFLVEEDVVPGILLAAVVPLCHAVPLLSAVLVEEENSRFVSSMNTCWW